MGDHHPLNLVRKLGIRHPFIVQHSPVKNVEDLFVSRLVQSQKTQKSPDLKINSVRMSTNDAAACQSRRLVGGYNIIGAANASVVGLLLIGGGTNPHRGSVQIQRISERKLRRCTLRLKNRKSNQCKQIEEMYTQTERLQTRLCSTCSSYTHTCPLLLAEKELERQHQQSPDAAPLSRSLSLSLSLSL